MLHLKLSHKLILRPNNYLRKRISKLHSCVAVTFFHRSLGWSRISFLNSKYRIPQSTFYLGTSLVGPKILSESYFPKWIHPTQKKWGRTETWMAATSSNTQVWCQWDGLIPLPREHQIQPRILHSSFTEQGISQLYKKLDPLHYFGVLFFWVFLAIYLVKGTLKPD